MKLLPKKEGLTNFRNWGLIALINTDTKVFIRLLNRRLVSYIDYLIYPFQIEFISGQLIDESGKLLHTIMADAETTSFSATGLLLDQEKAYNHIHPS